MSVEILDDRMYALPPAEAARRIGDATRAVLAIALDQRGDDQ